MSVDNGKEMHRIYAGITEYCRVYNVPREHLLDILEDQKVLPMIRGKATEYVGAAFLKRSLSKEWSVEKLNLNTQAGQIDEDISVTFRRTGKRLKAETKNAVRGSFRLRGRGRPTPHFTVKCHKSRSNLQRQKTSNDRYLVGEFDLLLCNVSNALFRGGALESGLPLLEDEQALAWLREFYRTEDKDALIRRAYDDWRFCLPRAIADEQGVLPRTPVVFMEGDPNWFGVGELNALLYTALKTRS